MRDLLVIYRDTNDSKSRLRRGFNASPTKVSGREWMVQKIAKQLLTTAGTNFYSPTYGTGFGGIIGGVFLNKDLDNVKSTIAQAIDKIEFNIKAEQILNTSLRDDEKLVSISPEAINYDQVLGTWEVFLKVVMENNSTYNIRI